MRISKGYAKFSNHPPVGIMQKLPQNDFTTPENMKLNNLIINSLACVTLQIYNFHTMMAM